MPLGIRSPQGVTDCLLSGWMGKMVRDGDGMELGLTSWVGSGRMGVEGAGC